MMTKMNGDQNRSCIIGVELLCGIHIMGLQVVLFGTKVQWFTPLHGWIFVILR
jgi:hypothetical protein